MKRTMALLAVVMMMLAASCDNGGGGRDLAPARGAELGLNVLRVQLLAGGDLARLDYRVVDPVKARRSLAMGLALLPDTADGTASSPLPVADVGTLGPLLQKPARGDRLQFVLFVNHGRRLRRGTSTTLRIGEARVTDIPVS